MAIPLTSESAPAALVDGDQRLVVERGPELAALVRGAADSAVGMVAAGGGRKGKRVEYRCVVCGYGIVVSGRPPGCPMCSETRWQQCLSGGRPYSHPRDGLALAFATRSFAGSLAADAQGSADQVFETEE